jgi:hypothetical protein
MESRAGRLARGPSVGKLSANDDHLRTRRDTGYIIASIGQLLLGRRDALKELECLAEAGDPRVNCPCGWLDTESAPGHQASGSKARMVARRDRDRDAGVHEAVAL